MTRDRNGLQVLDRRECLELLTGATLGRIGISSQALPVVLPVTFRLVGDEVVFTTSSGAKLAAATDHAVVAFEVDHFDVLSHSGWSVLVTGIARPVVDGNERAQLWATGIPRWLSSDDARLVAISTERISGRRIVRVADDA